MANMNISLPDAMKEWIEERVQSGKYANVSDYVRDLIRHDRERREALVRALIEGEQSGRGDRTVKEIIADTKCKIGDGEL
jgi:antitoxin ParD1/3/4